MEDQRYFRDVVRRTRTRAKPKPTSLIQSLIQTTDSEPEPEPGPNPSRRAWAHAHELGPTPTRRVRGDLRAASVMRDCGLWLNRDKRIVGSIRVWCQLPKKKKKRIGAG